VGVLMRQRRVLRDVLFERLERRHLDMIIRRPIIGLVATVAEIGADVAEERFSLFDALQYRHAWFSFRRVAVDLGGIEHRVSTDEQQTRARWRRGFIVILGFGRIVRKLPKDHGCALLTLANLRSAVLPLFVCSPLARLVTFRSGGSPQAYRVDAAIGLVAGYVDRAEGMTARRVPRHAPVADAFFNCADD